MFNSREVSGVNSIIESKTTHLKKKLFLYKTHLKNLKHSNLIRELILYVWLEKK